jgi:magnesium chelatase family protein
MLARATTFTIDGLEPRPVVVEVDVRPGLPAFAIVGLADAALREARERVRAAIQNSGFEFPQRRIVANLAPASLPKSGPGFDLALALGILAASGQLPAESLEGEAVCGELSLSGGLSACRGTLAIAEGAARAGLRRLLVPHAAAREARLVESLHVRGVADLRSARAVLVGELDANADEEAPEASSMRSEAPDLDEVRGHAVPIRALEIAAAGGHSLLLQGAPGTGKTMLARRLPSILPPLERDEALEVTRIHSVAGVHDGAGLVAERPFRAPHHTISAAGLVGGGSHPAPGEATLAHRGVLFLDELSEFSRPSLEALRQPLEDGFVHVVRGQRSMRFPTRFALIAATNPCPCGMAGVDDDRCTCADSDLARYARRLSGPLLDRVDMVVDVHRPSAAELGAGATTTSASTRERVVAARERAADRLRGSAARSNAEISARQLRRLVELTPAAARALEDAYDARRLSARAHQRALRIARTVADLASHARVELEDVRVALGFRRAEPAVA